MGTKIVYQGPFEAVEVPEAGVTAERGKVIEVDSDLAKRMLEQEENWKRPSPSQVR